MVAALTDIEESQKISCLTGRGKHGCRAALHGCDLGCHMVIGGVLESGIEISGSLQIKEFSHVLAGIIFEGRGLDDGDLPRLPVSRFVTGLYAFCTHSVFVHHIFLLLFTQKMLPA